MWRIRKNSLEDNEYYLYKLSLTSVQVIYVEINFDETVFIIGEVNYAFLYVLLMLITHTGTSGGPK